MPCSSTPAECSHQASFDAPTAPNQKSRTASRDHHAGRPRQSGSPAVPIGNPSTRDVPSLPCDRFPRVAMNSAPSRAARSRSSCVAPLVPWRRCSLRMDPRPQARARKETLVGAGRPPQPRGPQTLNWVNTADNERWEGRPRSLPQNRAPRLPFGGQPRGSGGEGLLLVGGSPSALARPRRPTGTAPSPCLGSVPDPR